MNPWLFSFEILSHFFIIFTPNVFLVTSRTISYSDHCNSFAPQAIPTRKVITIWSSGSHPLLYQVTSHYTGGQNIFDQSQRSMFFAANRTVFETNVTGTYKFQAQLTFFSSNIYHQPSNFTYYSQVGGKKYRRPVVFYLDGFWSMSTNKLCMVGSTRWLTKQGNPLKLNAVLKLKFARFITLNTSLVSGTLESLASPHDFDYFDPIVILGFPRLAPYEYTYSMISKQEFNRSVGKAQQDLNSLDICSLFTRRFTTYKLEYPSTCKNCSLLGPENGYVPSFMSLYVIQCNWIQKKLRFLVEFQDRRHTPIDQSFNPDIALIGEGTWNGTKDELCIVACHILNQSDPLGSARVGDCSIKLTLWFPAIRSIKNTHNIEGRIWSTKITDEMGSFETIKFHSFDHSLQNYGWRYEYTQMEKVKLLCPRTKHVEDKHQFGYYGFDMSVKHKNMLLTGFAAPIFVGNQVYNSYPILDPNLSSLQAAMAPAADYISATSYNNRRNVSFEISFRLNTSSISRSGISSLSLSSTDDDRVEISAEGFYDDEAGQICMVGCRNLNFRNASFDCEIVVKFQLPQGDGSLLKGSIASLREKTDVLYFERLDILPLTYTETHSRGSIKRTDLEIIIVLTLDILMCVFIGQQLFHLTKRSEMVSLISVLMMLILTFGNIVPLVLYFEAIFSHTHKLQNIGLLEVTEVIVTMVAFILQFRLLQLTWTAKRNHWIHEIWTLVICIPMYIIGGSAMLLVNWKNDNYATSSQLLRQSQHSVWDDLTSYAGLTLDGFLFPQLILNIFQNSKGNALSHSFYMGITFVRLLPHAYDMYRGLRYISHRFDRFYANPRADFHSPSWDIGIGCGGIMFVIIIFLQQHYGGRFMFPKRFQESVEYEMVPKCKH